MYCNADSVVIMSDLTKLFIRALLWCNSMCCRSNLYFNVVDSTLLSIIVHRVVKK